MNKLEQYLDQVCQSVGGPWAMREHVRQEMREHLLDAVAQHKAAGMSDEQALDKALEEFGKPDEVRSDLESTYGKRTTWIIDKALEWKEKTMRAKWLWATWAYLGLASVIGLEIAFIASYTFFLHPKVERFLHDGLLDWPTLERDYSIGWMLSHLYNVAYVTTHHWYWIFLPLVVLWGLFEWRVRSESKSFMRFAALGTMAISLTVVVMMTTVALVIPFCLMMPMNVHMARPWAIQNVEAIDKSLTALEKAHINKDWPAMHEQANRTAGAALLLGYGPGPTSLAMDGNDQVKAEEMRAQVRGVEYMSKEVLRAIQGHDEKKLDTALQDFRKVFDPVREAAKKLKR